jgi:hypothetical protein
MDTQTCSGSLQYALVAIVFISRHIEDDLREMPHYENSGMREKKAVIDVEF